MRRDGGLRTGIESDDERLLEHMDPGAGPRDSALLWFVDIRCSGVTLPSEPEEVRQWFLDRSGLIRAALRELSEELIAGIDSDWPLRKEIPADDGVEMAIYCSAIRRLSGREISGILSQLDRTWIDTIRQLGRYHHSISVNG